MKSKFYNHVRAFTPDALDVLAGMLRSSKGNEDDFGFVDDCRPYGMNAKAFGAHVTNLSSKLPITVQENQFEISEADELRKALAEVRQTSIMNCTVEELEGFVESHVGEGKTFREVSSAVVSILSEAQSELSGQRSAGQAIERAKWLARRADERAIELGYSSVEDALNALAELEGK